MATSTSGPNHPPVSEDEVKRPLFFYSETASYLIMDPQKISDCRNLRCFSVDMAEMVTVQLHKLNEDRFLQELAVLEAVNGFNSEKYIVKLCDHFSVKDKSCLVFERLDRSLFNLMCEREWMPLTFNEIRLVTHQLLVSVEAIHSINIVHNDLKLENVMLVNHKDKPFKIKLINFSHAFPAGQVKYGDGTQNEYTAPEETLGLALSKAVDMWGVGCIMLYLYLGKNPNLYNCAYSWIKTNMNQPDAPGWPDDKTLWSGMYSWKYFIFNKTTGWRLRTPQEYQEKNGKEPHSSEECFRNLEEALKGLPINHANLHRMAFLDLVKCCLRPDADRRLCPSLVLKHHPFFIMVDMAKILKTISSEEEYESARTISCDSQEEVKKVQVLEKELDKLKASIKQKKLTAEKNRISEHKTKPSVWKRIGYHLGLGKPRKLKKPKDHLPNRPRDDSTEEESDFFSSSFGTSPVITASTDEDSVRFNTILSDQQKTKDKEEEDKLMTKLMIKYDQETSERAEEYMPHKTEQKEVKQKKRGPKDKDKLRTKAQNLERKLRTIEREEEKQRTKAHHLERKLKTIEREEEDIQKMKEREEEDRRKMKEREKEDKQKVKDREEEDRQLKKEREEEDRQIMREREEEDKQMTKEHNEKEKKAKGRQEEDEKKRKKREEEDKKRTKAREEEDARRTKARREEDEKTKERRI